MPACPFKTSPLCKTNLAPPCTSSTELAGGIDKSFTRYLVVEPPSDTNTLTVTVVVKTLKTEVIERVDLARLFGVSGVEEIRGEIQSVQEFRGELPHGSKINYHMSGYKISEEFFRMGEKHGEQKFYHDDGGVQGLQHYRNGMKCNVWETYNKDTSIQSTIKYQNGIKTYECSYRKYPSFDKDRIPQIVKEINYVDGKMDGNYLDCFVNGKRRTEGKMINGEMNGTWNFYMNDGNTLELSVDMDAGEIVRVNYKRYLS